MLRTQLVAVTSLVAAASLAPTMPTHAVVVLAALAAATALMVLHARVTVPDTAGHTLRPGRRTAAIPLVLAGRTTDVVHHPVRPRAPGLV